MTSIALALASAACFAVCTVIQFRATQRSEGPASRLVLRLLQQPLFLVGLSVEAVAVLLQGAALATGTVVTVQPLLCTGVILAVPLAAALDHRSVPPRELAGVGLSVAGLGCFLASSRPAPGHPTLSTAILVHAIVPLTLLAGLAMPAGFVWPRWRGALLGTAAGTAMGMSSCLFKVVIHNLSRFGWGTASTWTLWALIVVGAGGTILSQYAFNTGALTSPLLMLTITEPVVAVALGVLGLHESLDSSTSALIARTLAVPLGLSGLVLLASSQRGRPDATTWAPTPDPRVESGAPELQT